MNQEHKRTAIELPNFDMPEVRKRLSPAALIGFFKMVEIGLLAMTMRGSYWVFRIPSNCNS